MGCGGSLPAAAGYLVDDAGVPPEGKLMAAPTTLRMTGWRIGMGYTSGGYAGELPDYILKKIAEGPQTGVIKPGDGDVLTISDEAGTTLAYLQMPKQQSFGVGASLIDPDGNLIAKLASTASSRPSGWETSSYCVYAFKPQFAGQSPDAQGRYLWAKCTRRAFTFTCTVEYGQGSVLHLKYASRFGTNHSSHKLKLERPDQRGVMLVSPTDEKPKRHHAECATGGDSILYLCIMTACNLAFDELVVEQGHSGNM